MAFLDSKLDLSMTQFTYWPLTNDHLIFARDFLTNAIKTHDPAWLRKPFGPLGRCWKDSAVFAACQLIELSRILSTLNASITKRSKSIYVDKFKQLLRAKNNFQFEEILTELQAVCHLVERIGPISLNPLVPDNLIGSSQEPPSPDFAIRLNSRDVFSDVTVLRQGAFSQWDNAVGRLSNEISRLVRKNKIRRIIYLNFPFSARNIAFSPSSLADLIKQISLLENGQAAITISSKELSVTWESLPHLDTNGKHPTSMPTGTRYATSGPIDLIGNYSMMMATSVATDPDLYVNFGGPRLGDTHRAAVAIEARLVVDSELNELLLKSLRNTLKRKREQFTLEAPFILIIKPGHHRLSTSTLSALLMDRIWPNKEYAWISGACLFAPRTFSDKINVPGLEIYDPPSLMVLLPNPGAANLLPQELVDIFNFWKSNYLNFGERITTYK